MAVTCVVPTPVFLLPKYVILRVSAKNYAENLV